MDDVKKTKSSVRYRPKPIRSREQCGNCLMFQPGSNRNNGVCSLVSGFIDPQYVCDRWEPAR